MDKSLGRLRVLEYGAIDPRARVERRAGDFVRAALDVRYTQDAYATVRAQNLEPGRQPIPTNDYPWTNC